MYAPAVGPARRREQFHTPLPAAGVPRRSSGAHGAGHAPNGARAGEAGRAA